MTPTSSVSQALPALQGNDSQAALHFLSCAARLLLEYNLRAELLKRQITRLAHFLQLDVVAFVSYRGVTLFSRDGQHRHAQAAELRINIAVSAGVIRCIDALCAGRIELAEAQRELDRIEAQAERHPLAVVALLFGLGAAALAWLLRADFAAIAVSGVASGLGLVVRRLLARRHPLLFALPFCAALLGALLGGLVIRLGWTATPGFCLMVPALMLVPGPHLINGVYDILENHIQTGMARLTLASGILLAAALGVFLGGWLSLGMSTVEASPDPTVRLTLPLDVALAGLAACAFAAFYNAPWRVLWISVLCGMLGHGLRFVLLQHGLGLEVATLCACLLIGVVAGTAAERFALPFAAVAFAGAVPMMPGVLIYQSLAGAMQIAAAGAATPTAVLALSIAQAIKAGLVVGAMALGLLLGARLAALRRRPR